jgi:hypothetical protein
MPSSALRPENNLLLLIARRNVDDSTAHAIRDLLRQSRFDWEYLSSAASVHGVKPLLTYHLEARAADLVPQAVLEQLQTENLQATEFNLWLAGQLVEIASRMHEAGLWCVSFKGPTLAMMAYGDLGLRPFSDLDLYIRRADFARLKALLTDIGFSMVRRMNPAREAALLRFDYALAFANEQDVLLDIHWRFAPAYASLRLPSAEMDHRIESISIAGRPLLTFSPEDLLLILACHGFSHSWEKLIWICDLATLFQEREDFDWDYVLRQADHSRVLGIVLLGLALAEKLGGSLPKHVREAVEKEEVGTPANEVFEQIFESAIARAPSLSLQLRMRQRLSDRIGSLSRFIFTPRDYDCMFASLPLPFLYYLVRPVRMARTYGMKILKVG